MAHAVAQKQAEVGLRVAVVAHFDTQDRVSANFRTLVSCLAQVYDTVVLVTTSAIKPSAFSELPQVKLITRPNVGYDFFSYRVGLAAALRQGSVSVLTFVNSSIALLDSARFIETLRASIRLATRQNVVGLTKSSQMDLHLQSYLLTVSRDVIDAPFFRAFFREVVPQDRKMDLILKYELGFSQAARAAGADLVALLEPSPLAHSDAIAVWSKYKQKYNPPASRDGSKAQSSATPSDQFNPSLLFSLELCDLAGIAKKEILRDNIFGVDLNALERRSEAKLWRNANAEVQATAKMYVRNRDAVAELTGQHNPLPSIRYVSRRIADGPTPRIACVLHLYYPDMILEMETYLRNIVEPFDLYITTPFEGLLPTIFRHFGFARRICVGVSENRGRDIGPFLSLLKSHQLDPYEAVLKIHSKKSLYSKKGDLWRKELLDSLLGTSWIVQQSVMLIENGAEIVGPHFHYLRDDQYWGANRTRVDYLLGECGIKTPRSGSRLGFFGGTMFWFAPRALRAIKEIQEQKIEFEPEAGRQDGTMAHVMERVFGPLVRGHGFATTSISAGGAEIDEISSLKNRVSVLEEEDGN